jgi:hypothetical protein
VAIANNNTNGLGEVMRTSLLALLMGILVGVGGSGLSRAADAPDAAIGTWTLNLAKSKFTPGPAPKSTTRTYAQTAQGISLSVTGVAADGSAISMQTTFKYDGKEYPYTGSPNYDSLSLKRVNGSTVKSVLKKNGKVVGSTTRTISAHRKVLTLSTKWTDVKGVTHDEVAVYDKQ